MKINFSNYTLKGNRPRSGALLRIDFGADLVGYADCHPWQELGDDSLQNQLNLLRQGQTTALTVQSLYFAKLDAEARSSRINLFQGLKVPISHYLLPNIQNCCRNIIDGIIEEGFTHIKIKLGSKLDQEISNLKYILKEFPSLKVRLDFNLKLTHEVFKTLCNQLDPWKEQIDFCEDPFTFGKNSWQYFQDQGFQLACDLDSSQAISIPQAASTIVIKPAVQSANLFTKLHPSQKIVFTSYLDHPFGQVTAAYSAAKTNQRIDVCGLLSHRIYDSNPFSEQLTNSGPQFTHPEGNGFGFDELLNTLQWQVL